MLHVLTTIVLLSTTARAESRSVTPFLSMGWRGYAMAGHLSHGPAFGFGASILDDHLRIGIGGTSRPGPINPATFPLKLEQPYKGKKSVQLRSDGGATGLLVDLGLPIAQDRVRVSTPILLGYGGYGFYLVDEDRKTPDGRKPSDWEDKLLSGADSGFGVVVDGGIQAAIAVDRVVRPTVSARFHTVLGYDASFSDRYAGPSVEFGLEVVPPRKNPTSTGGPGKPKE